MKRIIITVATVLVLIFGLVLFSGNDEQIIDVRTPEEYAIGHISGATNIPLATMQAGDFSKLRTGVPIKVYCRSGKRAAEAKVLLEKAGYKNVENAGSLSSWQDKGGMVCISAKLNC